MPVGSAAQYLVQGSSVVRLGEAGFGGNHGGQCDKIYAGRVCGVVPGSGFKQGWEKSTWTMWHKCAGRVFGAVSGPRFGFQERLDAVKMQGLKSACQDDPG